MEKYEITKKLFRHNDECAYEIVHTFEAENHDAALEEFADYCRLADLLVDEENDEFEALMLGTEAEDFATFPRAKGETGCYYEGYPRIGLF